MKKIVIASDRAGLELKTYILEELSGQYDFEDLGTNSQEPVDYSDYALKVVNKILDKSSDFGILICGTGIGMSIAANRHKGIRAGLCHNSLEARLTREHNDANILCLGGRIIGKECALENVKVFLQTDFAGGRHVNRVKKLDGYTNQN